MGARPCASTKTPPSAFFFYHSLESNSVLASNVPCRYSVLVPRFHEKGVRRDMSRIRLSLGLLLAALPVLWACSSDAGPQPTPTPDAEAAYVAGLTEVVEQERQARQRFEDLMGPIFPRFAPDEMQAQVLFNALQQARILGTTAEMLKMFELLTPPRGFAEDHDIYLKFFKDQVATAQAIDEAIKARDLPHVHLKTAELEVASQLARATVSPEFCRYVTPGPPGHGALGSRPPPQGICGDEQVPGGEYGAAINKLLKRFQAQFAPRASFPPGMTPDELMEGLTYVQPAIIETFGETLAELDAIEPPTEYEAGHQVLHDYFDELLSTARAIDRAVAARDYDQVMREFDRSGEVTSTADDRLPQNYRPLVEVIFAPGE